MDERASELKTAGSRELVSSPEVRKCDEKKRKEGAWLKDRCIGLEEEHKWSPPPATRNGAGLMLKQLQSCRKSRLGVVLLLMTDQ